MKKAPVSYSQSGVDYNLIDPLKRMAQTEGKKTSKNLAGSGFKEIKASRGESAYVVEGKDEYLAFVQEGLGTKNLVADEMRKVTGKTYYDALAQDTVAMIVNDLITVGACPTIVLAYWAVGDSSWFKDKKRMEDLVSGWALACNLSGVSWGGGETPTLKGVIQKGTIDLAGSAFGTVSPKSRLTLGDKLQAEDVIMVFESSGIHANGLTLARTIVGKLPEGYATELPNGEMYGEALLNPTVLYAKLVADLFKAGVKIHYMANITGHGWRKLMRANKQLTYRITSLAPVPQVLQFIQEKGPVNEQEMYANFNMGAGFAIFVPKSEVAKVKKTAKSHAIQSHEIGHVEDGKKCVIVEPKRIEYTEESLQVKA